MPFAIKGLLRESCFKNCLIRVISQHSYSLGSKITSKFDCHGSLFLQLIELIQDLMSLSTLPLVVFDTLSVNLDLRSLLALSSTSKSLHHQTNQVLYVNQPFDGSNVFSVALRPILHTNAPVKLWKKVSLSILPNSFFVRKHKTFNVEILQKIWSDLN